MGRERNAGHGHRDEQQAALALGTEIVLNQSIGLRRRAEMMIEMPASPISAAPLATTARTG